MKAFVVAFFLLFLAGIFAPLSFVATNSKYGKQKSRSTSNGSIPWGRKDPNTGRASTQDGGPIGCISATVSIAPTLKTKSRFIDTYSNYLAGHPEKFMLIDLFDAETKQPVGEYGFGGFKLYPKPLRTAERPQKK